MNSLKGKKVLLFQQRGWGMNIGHFLAQKLQEQGCELAALTLKKDVHEFMKNQKEVDYKSIVSNDEIMGDPKEYLAGESYSLEEVCRELGVDTVWPLVLSLRNHVRSYKYKYYYGYRQNVSDEGIIDYITAFYKYIKYIFDTFKPDIILSPNFVALPHIMMNLYAKKCGVKMLAITDCKVQGRYIFTYNYQDSEGPFFDKVRVLNEGKCQSNNIDNAKKYIEEFRIKFKKPNYTIENKKNNFKQIIKKELSPWYKIVKWYLKPSPNLLKSTGITLDYRPPKIILRDHFAHKKYTKFMNNFSYYPFDKIKKFVYFPLQFQPEATIDVASPFFSNQIETARLVAMSLPDDYVLVVKEHPAMLGLRSPSYLEKIDKTPNVKLIDYRISSEEVLKKAHLVISPNSTTIVEAAFLKKPVIQLGDLGTTLLLPNVEQHTDMRTLSKKIKEMLQKNFYTNEYERKLENFVTAAYDCGFDVDYVKVWEGKKEGIDKLWKIYRDELEKVLLV